MEAIEVFISRQMADKCPMAESCGTYTQWNITQKKKKERIWVSSNEVDETGTYYRVK